MDEIRADMAIASNGTDDAGQLEQRVASATGALADVLEPLSQDELMEAVPVIVKTLADRGVELPEWIKQALGV